MRPRRVVVTVGLIVLVAVILICGLMYTSDSNTYESLVSDFGQNTQGFDRTSVSTVVEQLNIPKEEDDYGIWVHIDTSGITSWLDACVLAHHTMYHAGLTYQASTTVTVNGMVTESDCNGFLGIAMYLYGLQGSMASATKNLLDVNSSLTNMGVLSQADYQSGDILLYNNHIEVYVEDTASGIAVYQWGSSGTAEQLYSEGIGEHAPADCLISIKTSSGAFSMNQPTVYRLNSGAVVNPPTPPQPQPPDPSQNLPGVPTQPPSPAGAKTLNMPVLIKQGSSDYSGLKLGNSSATVASSGCFASSIQMIANYLTSPNTAWSKQQIINNFKLDYFTNSGGLNTATSYMSKLTNGQYGVSGDYVPALADIDKSIDNGKPVIMHFTGATQPYYGGSGHFLVINGYDTDTYYLMDPGAGLQSIPRSAVSSMSTIKVRYVQ